MRKVTRVKTDVSEIKFELKNIARRMHPGDYREILGSIIYFAMQEEVWLANKLRDLEPVATGLHRLSDAVPAQMLAKARLLPRRY